MSTFKTQSLLTLTIETGYSGLGSAGVVKILYTKPNRTPGFFAPTISGTKLVYNIQNGDIDIAGVWSFQSYIEVGGLKGFGNIVHQNFEVPLG